MWTSIFRVGPARRAQLRELVDTLTQFGQLLHGLRDGKVAFGLRWSDCAGTAAVAYAASAFTICTSVSQYLSSS